MRSTIACGMHTSLPLRLRTLNLRFCYDRKNDFAAHSVPVDVHVFNDAQSCEAVFAVLQA